MKRKPKYKTAGILLSHGEIKKFNELKHYVSKVNFGKEIGVGYKRMNQLFGKDISSLSLGEIFKASQILDVQFIEILYIALIQFQKEVDPKCKIKIIEEKELLRNKNNNN